MIKVSSQKDGLDVLPLTDVTCHEGYNQLLGFAALTAGLGNNILVEQLHSSLKAGKLHHGVGDLPHPQGNYTLIETGVNSSEEERRQVTQGHQPNYVLVLM